MKNLYEKLISHITKNIPVYVMIFLMFLIFYKYLNVQINDLKVIIRTFVKVCSFIAFVLTTSYLFYDVIYTVESDSGLIKQNNNLIKELESKKEKILNGLSNMLDTAETQQNLESPSIKQWMDFFISKLDEANTQQNELRKQNIEAWKWKIGTLITLNTTFISIAKFF